MPSDHTLKQFARVALDGELTIYRAADLKLQLLDALDQAQALEIDLAAVTELDTAGVQVLMLVKRTALAADRPLRLLAHSPAVLEVFELLDLGAWFGDALLMAPQAADRSSNP